MQYILVDIANSVNNPSHVIQFSGRVSLFFSVVRICIQKKSVKKYIPKPMTQSLTLFIRL